MVGGGSVAERKVNTLLQSGAVVTVVSPECTAPLSRLADSGHIIWKRGEFSSSDIRDSLLVIAATDNPGVNQAIFQAASQAGRLVNVADSPEQCNFIVPSVIERGDLLIAVSTSGASPALAKKVRQELEALFGEEYTRFLEIMAAVRKQALEEITEEKTRQEIFRQLVSSEMLSLIKQGRHEEAERLAQEIYRAARR